MATYTEVLTDVALGDAGVGYGTGFQCPVTINNSGGPALTDYQILAILDTATLVTAGKMRSDCGDLRVYDSDNIAALPYWINPGTINTSATRIWIKVDLTAGASKTIYLMYGNLNLTTTATGSSVFDFFDDFLGSSLDATKWNITGTVTVSNSEVCCSGGQAISKNYQLGDGIVEYRGRTNQGLELSVGVRSSINTGNAYDNSGTQELQSSTYTNWKFAIGTSGVSRVDSGVAPSNNVEYAYRFVCVGTNLTGYRFADGFQGAAQTTVTYNNSGGRTSGYVCIRTYSGDICYVDWFYVRKYTATEPAATVGSETTVSIVSIIDIQHYVEPLLDSATAIDLIFLKVKETLTDGVIMWDQVYLAIKETLIDGAIATDQIFLKLKEILSDGTVGIDSLEDFIKVLIETLLYTLRATDKISYTLTAVDHLDYTLRATDHIDYTLKVGG